MQPRTTSTTKVSFEYIVAEESAPIEEEQTVFDPELAAQTLRRMSRLEDALFGSGLSAKQKSILMELRECRAPLWRMVPEGF